MSSLSFEGGMGVSVQSVINEHFKRLIAAAKIHNLVLIGNFRSAKESQTVVSTPDSRSCFIVEMGETLNKTKKLYHS